MRHELKVITVLRWIARIMGTLLLLLIATIAIGEGFPNPLAQPLDVILLFAAMLTMVVGLIVAWKWEGVGGLLILGGFTFFAIVNHGIQLNLAFGPILVVGMLYLLCACLQGWKAHSS
jgi:hypothetical protein